MFGARGTGKTSLLKAIFQGYKEVFWLDLLDDELYQRLVARPKLFLEMIPKNLKQGDWVIADEIQRVPGLLNYVHQTIEARKIKFALTGSSARKLKSQGANLLAGRAFNNYLFPLTHRELGASFNLEKVLNWGSLPEAANLESELEKSEYLKAYVSNYIRQEIKEEQIVRRIDPFVRFLDSVAQCNGKIINASKIGRDASVDGKAILRYYEILEDTLLGFYLNPFERSARRVQTAKSKFYLFDLGVKKALEGNLNSRLTPGTSAFGDAFEHFFILECLRLSHYLRIEEKFFYCRTKDDVEIDLIIQRGRELFAIEIKSSDRVDEVGLRSSIQLAKDLKAKKIWIASRETRARQLDKSTEILPWQQVLEKLYPR